MTETRIGIIMNGVTGRMGARQHLARSIAAIRTEGGVSLPNGDVVMPDPVLVGRNEQKLRALAEEHGVERWSADLDACLANPDDAVYFDAQITSRRVDAVRAAIAAGKHIYCEKPTAGDLDSALDLVRLANRAGVKSGVVQDKLFLPGLLKLKGLIESGYFGRILSVRGEFGYWVFEDALPLQRPSWNYRREDGGGIIMDMLPHWRYLLDNLFGAVRAVSCIGATHVRQRLDEAGDAYNSTADDAAYATFDLEGGIVAHINSSWATRVYRDELFVLQVDGTDGSAVAGLRECKAQHRDDTPKALWDPDSPNPIQFREGWADVRGDDAPENATNTNAFRYQWEMFLRHVACGEPFPWSLLEGAKGVQLAELALRSWSERRWIEIPELSLEEESA